MNPVWNPATNQFEIPATAPQYQAPPQAPPAPQYPAQPAYQVPPQPAAYQAPQGPQQAQYQAPPGFTPTGRFSPPGYPLAPGVSEAAPLAGLAESVQGGAADSDRLPFFDFREAIAPDGRKIPVQATYKVQVSTFKESVSRTGATFYVLEGKILESDNAALPPGTDAKWLNKTPDQFGYIAKALMRITAACMGWRDSDPDPAVRSACDALNIPGHPGNFKQLCRQLMDSATGPGGAVGRTIVIKCSPPPKGEAYGPEGQKRTRHAFYAV